MSATVTVALRAYGDRGGSRWRVCLPNGDTFETADHARALQTAEQAGRRTGVRVEIRDSAPEQLTLTEEEGIALAMAGSDPEWVAKADAAIRDLAATGRPFQAFDVVQAGCPEPGSPSWWGPRFRIAAKRGLIESAGGSKSIRPGTRGSMLNTWRGTATARALEAS